MSCTVLFLGYVDGLIQYITHPLMGKYLYKCIKTLKMHCFKHTNWGESSHLFWLKVTWKVVSKNIHVSTWNLRMKACVQHVWHHGANWIFLYLVQCETNLSQEDLKLWYVMRIYITQKEPCMIKSCGNISIHWMACIAKNLAGARMDLFLANSPSVCHWTC